LIFQQNPINKEFFNLWDIGHVEKNFENINIFCPRKAEWLPK